jgi:hypothetical protein
MREGDEGVERAVDYPVGINVRPALEDRNRLTSAFRVFLALPHILLVGGPAAMVSWLNMGSHGTGSWSVGSSTGVLGAVAAICALIAWFAIVFTGRYPDGLRQLAIFYLRWRVRGIAYVTLLRDEYPPFGDDGYPAELVLEEPAETRNRLTVFFRLLLAVPHLFVLALLGLVWAFTTALAWLWILFTGRYPETLYGFAIGVFAWSMRVEAYVLLLYDEYPPFTLRA